ncbi:hypothetical protein MBLNU230_g6938t1 [Neophaeotheca triangularis]
MVETPRRQSITPSVRTASSGGSQPTVNTGLETETPILGCDAGTEREPPMAREIRDNRTDSSLEKGPGEPKVETSLASGLQKSPSNDREKEKDSNLVTFDGADDPQNPKNWSKRKKWAVTGVVSLFVFISPVSSSMIAPGLQQIQSDFEIGSDATVQLALSTFVLAFAFGPLFLGPLSELFGRRIIFQLSNLFYFAFNLACGFSQNLGQLIAFRFLSGLGGSAPLGVGGGVIADIWLPQERGKAMGYYALMPLLGPAVGPIAGGYIVQYTTWRWVFWSTCIAAMVIQAFGLFYLKETYAPEILKRKKHKLIEATGNRDLFTEFDTPNRTFRSTLGIALSRPFIMISTQPIVQILALYIGYLYGVLYLVFASFPVLWTTVYNQNAGTGGLNYISLGVGFFLGAQIAAHINDRVYKRLKARHQDTGRPEFRVPLMMPGTALVPIGLFLYGWSAEYRTHWVVPNIGAAIFAAGQQMVFQCCQTYIVDSYTRFAASGIAATMVLRSLGGFTFPLFAPGLYDALGYGWGNSVLGFAGVVLGIPAPFLLWKYGARLRVKSGYAAG